MTKKIYLIIFSVISVSLVVFLSSNHVQAQTNVRLNSLSQRSGTIGEPLTIYGSNLNRCSPPADQSFWDSRCNVQFHDIESRRTTVSGIESANVSNATVFVNGIPTLCPGSYIIRVGEVVNNNWSNNIPFYVLEGNAPILDQNGQPIQCRFITSINPGDGPRGTSVTINGRNLDPNVHLYGLPSGLAVASAGDITATVTGTINSSRTQVVFAIPATLPPGPYTVRVGPNQNDLSNGVNFDVTVETVPPVISNVRITNITSTEATVTWDTNEPADSQVEVCTSYLRCGADSQLDDVLVRNHSITLTNLMPGTLYYIWVKSRDESGNRGIQGYFTFRTSPVATQIPPPSPSLPPPPPPPVISNVQVTNITRDSAVISFDTDTPAWGSVYYCRVVFFCRTLGSDINLTTSRFITINNLESDRDYNLGVIAGNDYGQTYSMVSFRTDVGLLITNVRITDVTQTTFSVSWDTNYPSSSQLSVCRLLFFCRGDLVSDPTLTTSHSMTLTNLRPGRRYTYMLISAEPSGYATYWAGTVYTLR